MRNLFVSLDTTENHPAVLAQLAGRRNEAMREQSGKADDLMMMMMMKPRAVVTPGGKSVIQPAFDMNDPRIDRFIERVCRGVLYTLFQIPYFTGRFDWEMGRPGGFANLPAEAPQRHVAGVFSCTGSPAGVVALDFYAGFPVWGRFAR